MLVVGLTGSIGMGKSTAAARFRHHGIPVFDADAAVHELYAGPAVAAIEAAFPGSVQDGRVDRQALSRLLDGKRENFQRLEAIVHPLVWDAERAFLEDALEKDAAIAVLEVPLLFETGLDAHVDRVVVTSASYVQQKERVLSRPGMTEEKFQSILALQTPDAEKRKRADFVVDTSGTIEESQAQIDHIVADLRNLEGQAFRQHWRASGDNAEDKNA